MRIAIISDIHANLLALKAVFADIQLVGVDKVLNLGDILYGPLWPRETYEFLKTNMAVTIQGNQDRQIYDATENTIEVSPILRLAVEELSDDGIEWLKSLPRTKFEGDIFLCHGAPESDLVYLLESVNNGEPCLRDDSELIELLSNCKAPVIVCGHTHIARVVRLSTGQVVINPGSVGLPAYSDDLPVMHRMQNYSPDASYSILEKTSGGYSVALRRVPYDYLEAAKRAREINSPGAIMWASWIETGRA